MNQQRIFQAVFALLCLCLCTLFLACGRQNPSDAEAKIGKPANVPRPDTNRPPSEAIDSPQATGAPLATIESRLTRQRTATHDRILDPASDGWHSEAFSAEVQRIIDELANLAFGPLSKATATDQLGSLLAPDFVCSPMRPRQMETVFDDGQFSVRRPGADWPSPKDRYRGVDGAINAMSELSGSLDANTTAHIHTKTIRVTSTENSAQSVHVVEASAIRAASAVEQHWKWTCQWQFDPSSKKPKLISIRTADYEETTADKCLFSEQTVSVAGNTGVYRDQLSKGLNHWLDRIEISHGMYVFAESEQPAT